MDRVARCRRATREAVADVSPPPLRRRLYDEIDARPLTPAVLTVESALAAEPGADPDDLHSLAAGTQLIYDGLQLTRRLAHDAPWADAGAESASPSSAASGAPDSSTGSPAESSSGASNSSTGAPAEPSASSAESSGSSTASSADADLAIVAADVLVARGFSLLSRTDAADRAVETIQAFGRDQTARRNADDPGAVDAHLERDVLDLAVQTGAAAVAEPPAPAMTDLADALADRADADFPPAESWLDASDATAADALASDGGTADHVSEGVE